MSTQEGVLGKRFKKVGCVKVLKSVFPLIFVHENMLNFLAWY